jgi:hypothetical protein
MFSNRKSAQMPCLAINILLFHCQNLLAQLKKLLLIQHRFFHLWSFSGCYLILVAESRQARGLEKTPKVAIACRETAKARFDLEKAKADNNDAYHGLLEAMGLTPRR